MGIYKGRIAITISPSGIDTVAFISANKSEALSFYSLIRDELDSFEERVRRLSDLVEGNDNEE